MNMTLNLSEKWGFVMLTWMHGGWKLKLWVYLSQKWRGSFCFQLFSQLRYCIQIIHVTVHNKIIPSIPHVHLLPSPMIGILQLYTCLLMPLLHSCPMHVAIYCKPRALIHSSTSIMHSYTQASRCVYYPFLHMHTCYLIFQMWCIWKSQSE